MPLVIDQFKRKYQKSVKDFILNIWKEFGFTYILEEDSDLDDIQKHYIDNGGAFYILRNDDKVMGTIGLVAKTDNTIELTRLYIDKSQRRPNVERMDIQVRDEKELNKVRETYCQLFRKVGGVNLAFIQPLSKGTLNDANIVLRFCKENADIVSLVVFTLYSDVGWTTETKKTIDADISVADVVKEIKKEFQYTPCAHLGSTSNAEDPSWLFSISVGFKDMSLGFFDGQIYKAIQEKYHAKKGRYLFTKVGNKITLKQLFGLTYYKCVRKIIWKLIKALTKYPYKKSDGLFLQTLLILRGPKFTDAGKRDLCEGCPDAMFYQGQLVPSCILEEIKTGKYADGVTT